MRSTIYKIQGTYTKVHNDLGLHAQAEMDAKMDYVTPTTKENNLSLIQKDICRTPLVDAKITYDEFCQRWLAAAQQENYAYFQGDTRGGPMAIFFNLYYLLETANKPPKEGENQKTFEVLQKQKIEFSFGYTNDEGQHAGISLVTDSTKPSEWIISIVHNSTAPHDQRLCTVYLNNLPVSTRRASKSDVADLFTALDSYDIADLMSHCILPNGNIDLEFATFLSEETPCTQVHRPFDVLLQYYGLEDMINIYENKKSRLTKQRHLLDQGCLPCLQWFNNTEKDPQIMLYNKFLQKLRSGSEWSADDNSDFEFTLEL